jgi:hypothetical protein
MQTTDSQIEVQIEFRGMNCPVRVFVSQDVAEQLEAASERRTLPDGTIIFLQPAHVRRTSAEQ